MHLRNETAAPGVGARNGGKTEKLGGTSYPQKYPLPTISAMPSTERAGLMARVVASGGKLYAVGHFAGRAG